ncbi:MAG: phosphoglycerate kinase [Catalinimonas sp.]
MKTIDDFNFAGKKAVVRVDFNVPLDKSHQITDDTRLRAAVPTIKKILDDGGAAILMSHLGRPKEGPEEKFSLRHLVGYLTEALGRDVQFADDCVGEQAREKAAALPPGGVLLLENLRFYKAETKGDADFAKKLADLGDVYVNDAFGTAHRAHASTAIIAENFGPDARMTGRVMKAELANADKVLKEAARPFTAIMGGAKISDKIQIIRRLLDRVDHLLIGGGMSYTFYKAQGLEIGNSLLEADKVELAATLLKEAEAKGVQIHLPADSVAAAAFDNDAETRVTDGPAIPEGFMGLDIGPETRTAYAEVIKNSKTILWNGPMGVFEMSNFAQGTEAVAKAIAEVTRAGAFSLIGGGDSAAAVNQLGYGDDVSYVSTGGGALLEYMEGKELPGVAALS